jgi:uncharacterized protein YbaR (Trm112 family)
VRRNRRSTEILACPAGRQKLVNKKEDLINHQKQMLISAELNYKIKIITHARTTI